MPLQWAPTTSSSLQALSPYSPGRSPKQAADELGLAGMLALSNNENPLGPSPFSVSAMSAAAAEAHRYPVESRELLVQALAERLGCSPPEIVIGAGSNELIDLVIRVFVPEACDLVTHRTAFIAYRLSASVQGCGYIEASVDSELRTSAARILEALTPETRVVCLANPNNPTGAFLDAGELSFLATELDHRRVLLMLDAAYAEYATHESYPDPMSLYRMHSNIIVLKTFSKVYGLAGARVGYLVADPSITGLLERARQPFNVSTIALEGARAALADTDHVEQSVRSNNQSKQELGLALRRRGFKVYPSEGNFVLVDFFRPARELEPKLVHGGLMARSVQAYGLPTCFRITCGLPEQNRAILRAIDSALSAVDAQSLSSGFANHR